MTKSDNVYELERVIPQCMYTTKHVYIIHSYNFIYQLRNDWGCMCRANMKPNVSEVLHSPDFILQIAPLNRFHPSRPAIQQVTCTMDHFFAFSPVLVALRCLPVSSSRDSGIDLLHSEALSQCCLQHYLAVWVLVTSSSLLLRPEVSSLQGSQDPQSRGKHNCGGQEIGF